MAKKGLQVIAEMAGLQTVHLDETLPARAEPESAPPLKRFIVSVKFLPESTVEAEDAVGAWEAYRKLHGFVKTDHVPTIREAK